MAAELRKADGLALRVGQRKVWSALPGGDSCPGAARRAGSLDARQSGAREQKGGAEQDDDRQPGHPGQEQASCAGARPRRRTLRPCALLPCCFVVPCHGFLLAPVWALPISLYAGLLNAGTCVWRVLAGH